MKSACFQLLTARASNDQEHSIGLGTGWTLHLTAEDDQLLTKQGIFGDEFRLGAGKIMRRVLAASSNFSDVGDVTTLANPEIVESVKHHVQSQKLARGEVPRSLTPEEIEEITKFGAAE